MKYAVMQNATPKGAASVRLRFDFGSIGETEKERGLAHFIEHMALNETNHVPEGEFVKTLERLGLKFGPDTNAVTGFDSTVYMLDLPQTDDATVDPRSKRQTPRSGTLVTAVATRLAAPQR
jgi:zinc protease